MKFLFLFASRFLVVIALAFTLMTPIGAQETAKAIYDKIIAIDKKNDASGGFASIVTFSQTYDLAMQLKKMALGGNADAALYWGDLQL